MSPDKPVGEPAIVVALDDQVVIEELIFDGGTKKEQNQINISLYVISKNNSQSDFSLDSLVEMKTTLHK